MSKFVALTGLDGSGKDFVGARLVEQDLDSSLIRTPTEEFMPSRAALDAQAKDNPAAHFFFYLASVIRASAVIESLLEKGNVYCVRYLIDTVVYHRALGLDVELVYRNAIYEIRRPDLTILLDSGSESLRQSRLHQRGELSPGDELVDDPILRAALEAEYQAFSGHFRTVVNDGRPIEHVVAEIRELVREL